MAIKLDNGAYIGEHTHCIASEFPETHKACKSSDALCVYEHQTEDGVVYDATCKSCNQYFSVEQVHSSSIADFLGVDSSTGIVTEKKKFNLSKTKERITRDEMRQIISYGYEGKGYRGISDETNKFFGHVTKKDANGIPIARYYPETIEGKLSGYKCRNFPKDFSYGKVGLTGTSCELSGQWRFKDYVGHRDVLVVGGEEDKAAAFQMLRDNQIKKGQKDYAPVAVVSPTIGENCVKQVQNNYDFLNQFENILIGLDNDEKGNEMAAKVAEVLPKDKVKIVHWTSKDPNKMLEERQERQFLADFYSAKPLVNSGILSSTEMMEKIREELLREAITIPSYMNVLAKMTKVDGLLQGRIINIIGDTSVGKSTHVNGMVYHFIFNAPVKPGVVSLEATAGQYALDMLSLHLEKNLAWYGTRKEILDYLEKPEIKALYDDLWIDEYGEPRWAILDEREGDIKELEKQMMTLVKKHGCKLLVIDVLTDILRGSSSELQEDHMKFQKNLVKSGVTIINVLHTRKPPTDSEGRMRKATEYDALGSSTFVQSAAVNIVINRDKMAKDPITKNTTYVDMPKCRGGETGEAGEWYYDPETRKVYDRRKFFSMFPDKLPVGYDLDSSPFSSSKGKKQNNKTQPLPSEPDFVTVDGGVQL